MTAATIIVLAFLAGCALACLYGVRVIVRRHPWLLGEILYRSALLTVLGVIVWIIYANWNVR